MHPLANLCACIHRHRCPHAHIYSSMHLAHICSPLYSCMYPFIHSCTHPPIHSTGTIYPFIYLPPIYSDMPPSIHSPTLSLPTNLFMRAPMYQFMHLPTNPCLHVNIHAAMLPSINTCFHPRIYLTSTYQFMHASIHSSMPPLIYASTHASMQSSIHHPFLYQVFISYLDTLLEPKRQKPKLNSFAPQRCTQEGCEPRWGGRMAGSAGEMGVLPAFSWAFLFLPCLSSRHPPLRTISDSEWQSVHRQR